MALNSLPFGKHVNVWDAGGDMRSTPRMEGRFTPAAKAVVDELVRQSDFEGTWEPDPDFTIFGTPPTYTSDGYFLRKGAAVYVAADITFSALGTATGSLFVRGLPYSLKDQLPLPAKTVAASPAYLFNATGLSGSPFVAMGSSGTEAQVLFYQNTATGAATITHANTTATTRIGFGLWYVTGEN